MQKKLPPYAFLVRCALWFTAFAFVIATTMGDFASPALLWLLVTVVTVTTWKTDQVLVSEFNTHRK